MTPSHGSEARLRPVAWPQSLSAAAPARSTHWRWVSPAAVSLTESSRAQSHGLGWRAADYYGAGPADAPQRQAMRETKSRNRGDRVDAPDRSAVPQEPRCADAMQSRRIDRKLPRSDKQAFPPGLGTQVSPGSLRSVLLRTLALPLALWPHVGCVRVAVGSERRIRPGFHLTAYPRCVGYHVGWDTTLCKIPCRVGYHAGWDVPPGMVSYPGYHAGQDTTRRRRLGLRLPLLLPLRLFASTFRRSNS
jgi:hypothetical protein